jgi:hypothetical protein
MVTQATKHHLLPSTGCSPAQHHCCPCPGAAHRTSSSAPVHDDGATAGDGFGSRDADVVGTWRKLHSVAADAAIFNLPQRTIRDDIGSPRLTWPSSVARCGCWLHKQGLRSVPPLDHSLTSAVNDPCTYILLQMRGHTAAIHASLAGHALAAYL